MAVFRSLFFFTVSVGAFATLIDSSDAAEGAASKVVVWIRPAAATEVELSPTDVPALRRLARRGASFPSLGFVDGNELVTSLRKLGKSLGAGKFHEIGAPPSSSGETQRGGSGGAGSGGAGSGGAGSGGALDELVRRLGKPPPVSKDDADAVSRLRKASGGRGRSVEVSGGAEPKPKAEPKRSSSQLSKEIEGALGDGARLVLRVDALVPASGEEQRARDRELESLAEVVGAYDRGGPAILIVVLLPQGQRPVMILAGQGVKKARVSRRRPDGKEFLAGVRGILRAAQKGSSDLLWLLSVLEIEARASVSSNSKGAKS